jgi:hypothetical protein
LFTFPLYDDKQIGISNDQGTLLCEAYDNDDDIDTKQSVMKYFVKVCQEDLIKGIMSQLNGERRSSVSLKEAIQLITKSE